MGQVVRGGLEHAVLELVLLGQRHDAERRHPEQRRDVCLGLVAAPLAAVGQHLLTEH